MHTCPNCGQACYCCGDIEDHETGEDENCEHWLECEDENEMTESANTLEMELAKILLEEVSKSQAQNLIEALQSICPSCNGDGYSTEPNICGHCHGTGRMTPNA